MTRVMSLPVFISLYAGARGLRAILEKLLLDAMFDLPGTDANSVSVTEKAVTGVSPLEYHYKPQKNAQLF